MKVTRTAIDGVLVLEPRVFGDERGFFLESFNRRVFEEAIGGPVDFVQDNHSRSARGVLRGLHYQLAPHAQGKLVRVTSGTVFDVAVDLRKSSPTFGAWVGEVLSADNFRQLWIPPGCAHGFLVMSDVADFLYKATDFYAPQMEAAIRFDDPQLAIQWPDVGVPVQLSAKDLAAQPFAQAPSFD